MSSVCQLFYVSSATTPVDTVVIQHVLQVARRNNRQLLHDSELEDSLEGLLLEGGGPTAIADVIDHMKPDAVMRALA